ARTLERLHRSGVFHRDIKPANLLIGAHGEVAVSDFDIAVLTDRSMSTRTLGSMSPPHAPPERLRGAAGHDGAGDIWSLASTLFTLLEGRPPFGTAEDPGGLNALVGRVAASPLASSRRADVPRHLWTVLEIALAKDPLDRFASAAEFADALDAVMTSPTASLRTERVAPQRRLASLASITPAASTALIATGTLGAVGAAVWLMIR
ncbi:MAG: protein kinase, partial [Actinobacteria bacterium]|nr:protein kinase [Actinomycetota bacterium]